MNEEWCPVGHCWNCFQSVALLNKSTGNLFVLYLSWLISEPEISMTMKGLLIQNFHSTLCQKGIKAHAWCYCCSSFLSLPLSSYILFICFSKSYEHMGFHPIHQVFLCSSHPTAGACMKWALWRTAFSVLWGEQMSQASSCPRSPLHLESAVPSRSPCSLSGNATWD